VPTKRHAISKNDPRTLPTLLERRHQDGTRTNALSGLRAVPARCGDRPRGRTMCGVDTSGLSRAMLVVAAVLTVALAAAGPACAKARPELQACGANECRKTTDESTLLLLRTIGDPTSAPRLAHQAQWFRIALSWDARGDGPDGWVMRYYPAAGMMRDHRVWIRLPDATIARFDELTRGLSPRGAMPVSPAGRVPTASATRGEAGLPAREGPNVNPAQRRLLLMLMSVLFGAPTVAIGVAAVYRYRRLRLP
jgi:hypothetical protein